MPIKNTTPNTETHESNKSTTTNNVSSYAKAVGNQNGASVKNLRTIMLVTKNEESTEEADRKRRVKNLIIHGKNEVSAEHDNEFSNNLIKDLQIGAVAIKQVERIGQKSSTNKRPIKLMFNSEEDKEKVLENLRNLKDNLIYKGISITNDLTYNERMFIKGFYVQA